MHALVELALAIAGDGKGANVPAKVPDGYHVVENSLRFARNGSKVAYVVSKGTKRRPVVGGTLGEEFDAVSPPVISASGDHIAFRAMTIDRKKRPHWTLVYDGKPFASDDWVGEVALAPNDGAPAFWLSHGWIDNSDGHLSHGPMVLQFGKLKSTKWQGTADLVPPSFSSDGKLVVSVGTQGGDSMFFVLDARGKESKHGSGRIVEAVVSPDGGEVAYSLATYVNPDTSRFALREFSIWREKLGAERNENAGHPESESYSSAGSPVYSLDSRHIAYKIEKEKKFGVNVDAWKDAKCEFDFVDEISLSPDDTKLAYLACNGCKLDDGNGYEILGGTKATGGKWIVVHGRDRSAEYEEVRSPSWSRDGKQFAYTACVDHKWHLFVGKKSSEPCDDIADVVWAEDGRSIAYGCRQGDELAWRTMALE